jgi:predicted metalloprotease
MRLDDFDPNSVDVEDQRGSGGGGFGGFPIGGRGGSIGCGTLVIALIGAVVFGVNPLQFLGGADQASVSQGGQQVGGALPGQGSGRTAGSTATESCTIDAASKQTCNALSSLNKTWQPIFAKSGAAFERPKLVFYAQQGQSGCGAAQSAMGPFYCPTDQGIYIDTDFYREMDQKLGAGGDFARDRRPTSFRCAWSFRPIATRASGRRVTRTGSRLATSNPGSTLRTRSVTIP